MNQVVSVGKGKTEVGLPELPQDRVSILAMFQGKLRVKMQTVEEKNTELHSLAGKEPDPNDEASLQTERDRVTREKEILQAAIERISSVISDIESGWDLCCKEPNCETSLVNRLAHGYATHHCVDCKAQLERMGKVYMGGMRQPDFDLNVLE